MLQRLSCHLTSQCRRLLAWMRLPLVLNAPIVGCGDVFNCYTKEKNFNKESGKLL